MALSNRKIEPRREYTESAVGIVAALIIMPLWVLFGMWLQTSTNGACPWPLGMLVIALALFLVYLFILGFIYGTHALGEVLCDVLKKRGLDPRPKQRLEVRDVCIKDSTQYGGYRYERRIVPV